MPISREELVSASSATTYKRGLQYFRQNRVTFTNVLDDEIQAIVKGSHGSLYYVTLGFINTFWDEILEGHCDCPAFNSSPGFCKHIVATSLAANAYQRSMPSPQLFENNDWLSDDHYSSEFEELDLQRRRVSSDKDMSYRTSDHEIMHLIHEHAQRLAKLNLPKPEVTELSRLEATLYYDITSHNRLYDDIYLTFKIGNSKLYVVKDVDELVCGFKSHGILKLGKNSTVLLNYDAFKAESHPLIDFILENYNGHRNRSYISSKRKALYLNASKLDIYLEMMQGQQISLMRYRDKQRILLVQPLNPKLTLSLHQVTSGYKLTCSPFDGLLKGAQGLNVIKGSNLFRCDEEYTQACTSLLESFDENQSLFVSSRDMTAFLGSVVPNIKPFMAVEIPEAAISYMPMPVEVKVYFDLDDYDGVRAHMTFSYGEETFDAFESKQPEQSLDIASEIKAEYIVSKYMGYQLDAPGTLIQTDEELIFELCIKGFDEIREIAEVYVSDDFNQYQIHPPINVAVGVRLEGRLLDISIDLHGVAIEELAQILNSYKRAKRYHRLLDGSFLDLSDGSFDGIAELVDTLYLTEDTFKNGHFTLDANRSFYLDALLKKNEQIRYERNLSFKEIISKMRDVEDACYEVPKNLQAILRNYQLIGYQWLRTLHDLKLGGILADDMGLGKTLQVLALLQSLKEEGAGSALVVCPTSLVYNWQAEAARFTPALKICAIAGAATERRGQIEKAKAYDLVVTSYDLLKRDIEHYKSVDFEYIILDEAQYIKNQNTQSAKTVKLISAKHRLALTGTPIENSLAELWSIFDFLMPNYLYSYHKFRQRFETAIAKQKSGIAADRLRALVRPFIIRRLKQDVLKELPDKIEQIHTVEMDNKQRKVYLATLAQTKKELGLQLKEAGATQSRIMVLAALTRMRQICCDPALVFDNYDGQSAKLEMCMDLVKSSLDGEHRIVLFSQFTTMLSRIKTRLDAEHIDYYILQGSTPKMERLKLVEEFNANTVKVFLISLKAGGTGLNLTGADVVIHYDPWWNLSAQNQATDRTHRIGQNKHVQVLKLIVKDTIEERVLELQRAKAELADSIIQNGENPFVALTSEELLELLSEPE